MILVFDLDDTLYDEATFVDSGFDAVAHLLSPTLGASAHELHERMRDLLAEYGRGQVFDRLLDEHAVADPDVVAACVAAYRSHIPAITLAAPVRDMLAALSARPGQPLYLVTDGDPGVQGRKIEALGLAPYFAETYRTWSFGRAAGKPSLHCFELIREREHCSWADMVHVADDPSKDFVSLRKVGARTIRVHTGRCAAVEAAPGFDAAQHADTVTDVPTLLGIDLADGPAD